MELQKQSKDRSQITAAIGTAIGTTIAIEIAIIRNRNNSSSAVKRKACADRV